MDAELLYMKFYHDGTKQNWFFDVQLIIDKQDREKLIEELDKIIIERFKLMITSIPSLDPNKLSCVVFKTSVFLPENERELSLSHFYTYDVCKKE